MSAYHKDILQTYAEGVGIFTHSPEGFRPGRGTQHATQLMQLLIEDATMLKNDIIVMQLDFSSAYNTVDHTRLQCIMEALGFRADVVRMTTTLFSNTRTTIEFSAGTTAEIHVTRGTEQGANHSPFLHNCFMEPLHRWLESGERGYKLTCV